MGLLDEWQDKKIQPSAGNQPDFKSVLGFDAQPEFQPRPGFDGQPLRSLLGFPIDGAGLLLPRAGGLFADALRNDCIARCADMIFQAPGGRRLPFSFEQCQAHCEGRIPHKPVQRFIPFPS